MGFLSVNLGVIAMPSLLKKTPFTAALCIVFAIVFATPAFAGGNEQNTVKSEEKPIATAVSGVIEIPSNLDVTIKTLAKKVTYDDLVIENLGGIIQMQNGVASLKNGTLGIIGATANMNGTYKNEGNEKRIYYA